VKRFGAVGDLPRAKDRADGLVRELTGASKLEPGSPEMQTAAERGGAVATRLSAILAGVQAGKVNTQRLAAFGTKALTSEMILPHTADLPGAAIGAVSLSACPGETESASLVLWAPAAVKGVLPTVTELKGPGGAIPATAVDLKWVKCWYQAGSAPHGVGQDRSKKVLVAELLLNDDGLVRVDLEKQQNELKLFFPAGPRYVDITDPTPPKPDWGVTYKLAEYPVKDSPKLLPADLPAEQNKQVWITVRAPVSAKSGRYTGKIRLTAGGAPLGEVSVTLDVLPFALPEPKTHYDLARDYTGSLYYWGELDPTGEGTIGYKVKSEQQFRAELQMMFAHNLVGPAMIWSPTILYKDETLFRRHLKIAREVGMSGRPLYTADSSLVGSPTEPDALRALQDNVRKAIGLAGEYGFQGVYFYGIDEATGEKLLSQKPAWQAVHEAGGKIIVSGYAGHLKAVGDILDLFNRAGDPGSENVAEWHRFGNKVWNYANPQTPVEDPEVYRRNYGLYDWRLDLDGVCTYCFMDSSGTQWNDFDCDSYRDHCLAYPTVDGVVGTLAIEGLREALDDVKYATALLTLADKLEPEGTAATRAEAKAAREWLDEVDTRQADLDAVRREMVRRIVGLKR
ncbi:MAG: hypothetical protein COZ06_29795, partial [Armatimonadetes bacterium CG_4_10_14_3_um_filter_66_18]